MNSNEIIGIDLGTSNSCVAIMDGKNPKVVENEEGSRTTPSVVSYDTKEKNFLVGSAAKRQAAINPETIFSNKRKMGTSEKVLLGGKHLTPEEISAKILDKMVGCVNNKLGKKITRAVITVPAYFNDDQKNATKNAGEIAGLTVERLIPEPTAAALAYGLDKVVSDQKILVYDLGGGTFDVSILQISKSKEGEGVFETLAVDGINTLGGDDFDKRIVDYLIDKFRQENGIDLRTKDKEEKDRRITLQRLQEAAQQAKHELSAKLEATVYLTYIASKNDKPLHLQVAITRANFANLTKDYMKKTSDKVDDVLKAAKLEKKDIEQIVLVGGSTRMPMVEELIKQKFGDKKINKEVNPDEVVAIGAAIQGAVLMGDFKDILLLDVTPLSLGVEVQGGINDIVIARNTTIPTTASRTYSTAEDNQPSVHIRVIQGERSRALDNKIIGSFELSDIRKAPRGVPQIEVTFDIDSNGIVNVSAKDKETNKEAKITITGSQRLNKEEIEKMKREAEENKEKDEEHKNNAETLNQAQSYFHTLTRQMEE